MGMASNEKKQFVCSAAQKKMFNQRKRKPDMRMAAVLECTLRRVSSEMEQCGGFQNAKRLKRDEDSRSSPEVKAEEFALRWEKAQSKSSKANFDDSVTDQSTIKEPFPSTGHPAVGPKGELQDQLDFEAFIHSLSDFSNAEMVEDLDDLLRELDFDVERPVTNQSCREEVEDFLNNFDPFFPGILDILCS